MMANVRRRATAAASSSRSSVVSVTDPYDLMLS
jgi:hypothetical protein